MKIINKLFILFLIIAVQSCAINVSEKNIILQDDKLSLLSEQDITKIGALKGDIKVEPLSLTRSDNTKAKGLWIKQKNSDAVIIYFSGNSMRIKKHYETFLPQLLALNTDIVWLDHRGIGGSEGQPTMENLSSDGLETFNFVTKQTNKKIIIHGLSLGSFIAGNIAINEKIDGLILEASATNTNDWINGLVPWYAKIFYSINVIEKLRGAGNEKIVQQYSGPLFVFVGEEDKVTPALLSQKLYDKSISLNKKLHIAKKLKHGNALKSEEVKGLLREFIDNI